MLSSPGRLQLSASIRCDSQGRPSATVRAFAGHTTASHRRSQSCLTSRALQRKMVSMQLLAQCGPHSNLVSHAQISQMTCIRWGCCRCVPFRVLCPCRWRGVRARRPAARTSQNRRQQRCECPRTCSRLGRQCNTGVHRPATVLMCTLPDLFTSLCRRTGQMW